MTLPVSSSPERFDANQVELAGAITRIWQRGSDVFVRLSTPENGLPSDALPRATLCLPGGLSGGREASLLKGDVLRLSGHLVDLPQNETLRDFLARAEKSELLSEIPALGAIDARVRRTLTCVVPDELQVGAPVSDANSVRLEGVAARVWDYDRHLFARLAVYDSHTQVTGEPGKNGRPRRIPHYLTVQFVEGMVGGRPVALKAKDRIRVSGILVDRPYSEDLRAFLLDAHQADILATLPNSDDLGDLRIRRSSACVVVQTMIQFTR